MPKINYLFFLTINNYHCHEFYSLQHLLFTALHCNERTNRMTINLPGIYNELVARLGMPVHMRVGCALPFCCTPHTPSTIMHPHFLTLTKSYKQLRYLVCCFSSMLFFVSLSGVNIEKCSVSILIDIYFFFNLKNQSFGQII